MPQNRIKKYSIRELMEEAVAEGERSIPEHSDKEDPFVGAILATKEGEIKARAHRGELRMGEHCEFTLLERKMRDQSLSELVLFVTLEPCTDASRNPAKGKVGCASHIVRGRISTVYVGIEDPDPRIANQGMRHLIANHVTVHPFEADLQEKIRTRNAKFIREKEEEAKSIASVSMPEGRSILDSAKSGSTIQGLSPEALEKFIGRANIHFSYPSADFDEWGTQFGVLERSPQDGSVKPTGLGMMLFGSRPSLLYPNSVFKTEIHFDEGKPEIKDFEDPLVLQWPHMLDHIESKAFRLRMEKSGSERVSTPDFPMEAIREAVNNAIIHRDYTIEGGTNSLYIDSERIIVRSPGGVAPPITMDNLKNFEPKWHSRNPKIMFVFNQMKLAEQRGAGIKTMRNLPSLGFPLPTFTMDAGYFVLTFLRTPVSGPTQHMSEVEYKEWLYIQANGPTTREQFQEHFGLPSKTAINHLNRLVKMRAIFSKGKGKSTKYLRTEN